MPRSPKRNAEGYLDPTAYGGIEKAYSPPERFKRMIRDVKHIVEEAGFEIQGRIIFIDKKTGEIWK